MNIIKKTWKAFVSLLGGFYGSGKSTGTPERARPEYHPDVVDKLLAAADALRQIECMTNDRRALFTSEIKKIHTVALDGYRAANK